jgi:solute:Na+ symporter, SSS family
LFVYYRDTGLSSPKPADRIYPDFIWNSLPPGIAGLVIAAILAAAMSNLSAALNSLASTTVMDFYRPLTTKVGGVMRDESHYLKLARRSTLVWGVVLFMVGWVARSVDSVLEAGLSIASILYGALLGVFLLGLLTRRVGENGAMAGMIVSMVTMYIVKRHTSVAWTWYVLIGTAATVSAGYVASLVLREKPRELVKT